MQRVYLVYANSDSTEGRGHDELKYVCSNEIAAKEMAKCLGPMGASDGSVKVDYMYDSVLERQQRIKEDFIRSEALKKLTDEEKRVLGIIK